MTDTKLELPRPEHPRPDWERGDWLNLNGPWDFRFEAAAASERSAQAAGTNEAQPDAKSAGPDQGPPTSSSAAASDSSSASDTAPASAPASDTAPASAPARRLPEAAEFEARITVPFSWASPLSGWGRDEKGIGWYRRTVRWTPAAPGSLVFLRFGAVDYECDVWVNGVHAGSHRGGYGSFELDVTGSWRTEADNEIVVRAEDLDGAWQARGKQGYGEIRGIWQPVWLEGRAQTFVRSAKFETAIDGTVEAVLRIEADQAGEALLQLDFGPDAAASEKLQLAPGANEARVRFTVREPRLWSPDAPHLYEGELTLTSLAGEDRISTYFGIREIGAEAFGERSYKWITLNGKPVYLNGTLDQSYHKTGYFTYPTDEEMREEIYLMKRLGLNFVRIHIKPEEPRKLYWADKLGILVMEDMPCFWGNPDERARAAYESEARETIERDWNHPSIFSWVMFNETWGLKTDAGAVSTTGDAGQRQLYLPETQAWVRRCYRWAKEMDPTRLVEDNSPCNGDHVETDLNTWHFYVNGYGKLREHVEHVVAGTHPGSELNYIGGNKQADAPLMNSECGNVWGIEGGAGDSDLAWHYRYMLNEFRRHDKLCGFVFTEFRDVTNEFNGYYRLDGSAKDFGYDGVLPGMSLRDLHAADFIVVDEPPCRTVEAGSEAEVKLLRSSYSDAHHGRTLTLQWELAHDRDGARTIRESGEVELGWDGYGVAELQPLRVTMPHEDAVAVLGLRLVDEKGEVVSRNFTTFDVRGSSGSRPLAASVPVADTAERSFEPAWTAIGGQKLNGGRAGSFAYDIVLPDAERLPLLSEVEIRFEAGSKRLLAHHVEGQSQAANVDFMHGDRADAENNANTHFMTGEDKHASQVDVLVDGERIAAFVLPDDPADARGILSWHYQESDRRLSEAGSYGWLCRAQVPARLVAKLDRKRGLRLELRAGEGGLSLYGRDAGRYPVAIEAICR
ncbi:glycoside hydrolase family 2 protein [Paenibacillus albicereus]|uniref:glycoside hydrolase family 2 protein n=1 Tax=Paenibacillus albicereus TaxID=2726185 RepID=UPI0019800235|nr:glycoside hydrolase family 2 TIM barrel-domain containing protein [Paenibacillus albicereus]